MAVEAFAVGVRLPQLNRGAIWSCLVRLRLRWRAHSRRRRSPTGHTEVRAPPLVSDGVFSWLRHSSGHIEARFGSNRPFIGYAHTPGWNNQRHPGCGSAARTIRAGANPQLVPFFVLLGAKLAPRGANLCAPERTVETTMSNRSSNRTNNTGLGTFINKSKALSRGI